MMMPSFRMGMGNTGITGGMFKLPQRTQPGNTMSFMKPTLKGLGGNNAFSSQEQGTNFDPSVGNVANRQMVPTNKLDTTAPPMLKFKNPRAFSPFGSSWS